MSDAPARPRVSIGMPVYNGADSLEVALDCLRQQTVRDIEIVISDNASTDATPGILRRVAAADPRIRYVRQATGIPVTDNFNFVLTEARAPYFMWAAHDDMRDPDFVERLVAALDEQPGAILAFGDVIEIINRVPQPLDLDFVNAGLSPCARLRKVAYHPLHYLYGVWRTAALKSVPWPHNDWWHDAPPMMAATMMGEFVHVPGVEFRYRYNGHPFFDWPNEPGPRGWLSGAGRLAGRSADLARLVWYSGTAVSHVAGPGYGVIAAWYSLVKVLRQIGGYVLRHHLRRVAG